MKSESGFSLAMASQPFKEIIFDFDQHWLSLFGIFVCHPFPLFIFLVITSLSKWPCLVLAEEYVHLDKITYYYNH